MMEFEITMKETRSLKVTFSAKNWEDARDLYHKIVDFHNIDDLDTAQKIQLINQESDIKDLGEIVDSTGLDIETENDFEDSWGCEDDTDLEE